NDGNFSTTGDVDALLDDAQADSAALTYSFNGLVAGNYALYTYAIDVSDLDIVSNVTVNGAGGPDTQVSGGQIGPNNPNQLKVGLTHTIHTFTLNSPGGVTVTVAPGQAGFAYCSGLQLVSLGRGGKVRVYVNDNATGANVGTTWTDALKDLQDALAIA